MSSSVGAQDVNMEKLRSDAMKGKWSEVFETCKQNMALYTTKITGTGDTVLHMAVSCGQEKLVANMVDFLVLEENNVVVTVDGDDDDSWSVNAILGAENDKKNTPLHLAAVIGNTEVCKKIGGKDSTLIARRNIAGETPLFLAALYGRKEAFLWLHYLYMEGPGVSSTNFAHCIRDNNDTILHCAIVEGHIDVAIEIIHLYRVKMKEMMSRNKEGFSPLHFLAAKSSAFKSTDLPSLVHSIYGFLKVEEKNQATTHEELQKENQENRSAKVIKFIMHGLLRFVMLFLLLRTFVPEIFLASFLHIIFMLSFSQPVLEKLFNWVRKMKEEHTWSLQIMNELLHHSSDEDMSEIISRSASEQLTISLQKDDFNDSDSGTITIETPLMIAAKNGVMEMVERITELFPSTIKDVNAEGKNIILLAVEYRQKEVFRFLSKQKWLSESLFGQVDKEGNNALHLAARIGVYPHFFNRRAVNWFEYVKDSMPRGLLGRYNRIMKTPEDIFRETRQELVKSEEAWVAKTSQAYSVVSTLVASVVYATRTSVPGGYDAKGGYAILRDNPLFKIFDVSSFLALFCSLISTIFFMSIVVSRPQSDLYRSMAPFKLTFAIQLMFISIVSLWISFCAANSFTTDDTKLGDALPFIIILSSFITLPVVIQLPTFFGPTLNDIPNCRPKATRPIVYRTTNI